MVANKSASVHIHTGLYLYLSSQEAGQKQSSVWDMPAAQTNFRIKSVFESHRSATYIHAGMVVFTPKLFVKNRLHSS